MGLLLGGVCQQARGPGGGNGEKMLSIRLEGAPGRAAQRRCPGDALSPSRGADDPGRTSGLSSGPAPIPEPTGLSHPDNRKRVTGGLLVSLRVSGRVIGGSRGQAGYGRRGPAGLENSLFEREGSLIILESWPRARAQGCFLSFVGGQEGTCYCGAWRRRHSPSRPGWVGGRGGWGKAMAALCPLPGGGGQGGPSQDRGVLQERLE